MAASPLLTQQQRVLRLYKKAVRHLQCWYVDRVEFRYQAVLLRARFDEQKNEKDMKAAVRCLEAGEKEFWERQHPQPYIFIDSSGGTRYERNIPSPEWVLDNWHPAERARYPTYFARREKRLQDETARWKELVAEEEKLAIEGKIPPPPPRLGGEHDDQFYVPK
ncbi:putative NADH dehydrogenase [Apostichopus japonicus]|uniref:NADH dehydrogenase [ubiquinone] 1 beta subcomplex subunit 9 n=1 Tax=Stichopus japonicus TaxID=307972 RepID=A0A2G8L0Z8_STIJA|nr:putative NADH dehydrogenase [Apostichopus japonicus]